MYAQGNYGAPSGYPQGGVGGYPPQQQPQYPPQQQQQQYSMQQGYSQGYAPQQQQQQQSYQMQQQQQQYQMPQQQQPQEVQQQQQQPVADQGGKPQPIYVDTQHDDMVHDAQLDFYGTKLATCSSDRTIKIYDIHNNNYTPTATLTGHTGPIYQLSWSHPKYGTILASASFDGSVLLHRETGGGASSNSSSSRNASAGGARGSGRGGGHSAGSAGGSNPGNTGGNNNWTTIKAFINLHESSVNSVQFAPHEYGLVCCAASSDGRVSVMTHGEDGEWTVEYLADCKLGVNSVSWAPYSVMATGSGGDGGAVPMPPRIVTGGCDNGIRIWAKNPATGVWEQEEFEGGHKDWVRDVAWAPVVVPGVSVIASCSEDRTVIIWKKGEDDEGNGDGDYGSDRADANDEGQESKKKWSSTTLPTFEDPVWRLSWSVTGNILAVSSGDSNVTLWKEELDGSWSRVTHVEDAEESGGAGKEDGGVGQQ
mmetsp:Transcript_20236/g.42115  ORF Transcript_20236/g.42115 Transcript_20236/m.42115 type:complete len:479 (+) Transcript_20236:162-1598(+)|eukprot:CAMPEP_0171347012 /NCGR_PEP_ID=MMETSP0878-20121228/26635_1 /TAXON_ID=67004 /ORGANISM="Thalassiosira weissflogii, Strain CCMP1336" /LENGTH=478 /DNA_ID=CAMNT_0011850903 /DNA_START=222 /DNA_END=1658 /DNA_ORIENTATION=+